MNRSVLFKAVELAHAAAHNTTCAASYDKVNPPKAEEFMRHAEDALNAALEALFDARLSEGSIIPPARIAPRQAA